MTVVHCLQDYLETKRVAFPRFYFVAPADLLDILSKGSNPQLILRFVSLWLFLAFDNALDAWHFATMWPSSAYSF